MFVSWRRVINEHGGFNAMALDTVIAERCWLRQGELLSTGRGG